MPSAPLVGLNEAALKTLVVWPDDLIAPDIAWQQLRDRYGGIPLLVHNIAARLSPFGNSLAACLQAIQHDSQFIQAYLDSWLAPLSAAEWQLLTWLMISHRPLSFSQLSTYLGGSLPLAAIESLCDRGICVAIVGQEPGWALALTDLLGPYLRDRFLHNFRQADAQQRLALLHTYPLLQAEAPEAIRQWQSRALPGEIAAILAVDAPQPADQHLYLQQALQHSRHLVQTCCGNGYSAGNLINLASAWHLSLAGIDCHDLVLRGADLQSDRFQGVTFRGADFTDTLLAKPLGRSPVIAVHPQQPQIAVGDQDGRLLLWHLQEGRLQRALLSTSEAITAIAMATTGNTLAEGRQDGQIRLWELDSEYGPDPFAMVASAPLRALAFSPDRQFLAGGDDAGRLYLWRLASGQIVQQIQAHQGALSAIAWSPCSRRLATCGQDCEAVEWDIHTAVPRHRFQGRLTSWLGSVTYLSTPGEATLQAAVIGRDEGQLVIWEIRSARPLRIMTEPCDLVMAVALSPDGRYLAASEMSGVLSLWDVDQRSRRYQWSES